MQPVIQIAYFVTDIRTSARRMAENFGAGPFYISSKIELLCGEHRGQEQKFLHSSAYGQWGSIMLELVQQDEEGPSPFRDMYKHGEEGIHHTAIFVNSIEDTIVEYQNRKFPLAARAITLQGNVEFAFIDTRSSMGHMLEIYEPVELLTKFYEQVKVSSINWDGKDPVRE